MDFKFSIKEAAYSRFIIERESSSFKYFLIFNFLLFLILINFIQPRFFQL